MEGDTLNKIRSPFHLQEPNLMQLGQIYAQKLFAELLFFSTANFWFASPVCRTSQNLLKDNTVIEIGATFSLVHLRMYIMYNFHSIREFNFTLILQPLLL